MVYMRQEIVLSITDLRYVCVKCPRCTAEVILDLTREKDPSGRSFAPADCSVCNTKFDTVIGYLNQFQQAYKELAKREDVVAFRADAGVLLSK
jgi:hypothetical protein